MSDTILGELTQEMREADEKEKEKLKIKARTKT